METGVSVANLTRTLLKRLQKKSVIFVRIDILTKRIKNVIFVLPVKRQQQTD